MLRRLRAVQEARQQRASGHPGKKKERGRKGEEGEGERKRGGRGGEAPQKTGGKTDFSFLEQDKLPTPFGLVRSGVAPDHQDTKNVTNQFERVLRDERARFFGNVEVVGGGDGRSDVAASSPAPSSPSPSPSSSPSPPPPPAPSPSAAPLPVRLQDLRRVYHAVVLAHGAESATPLGLPLLARRRRRGKGGGTGGAGGGGAPRTSPLPPAASAPASASAPPPPLSSSSGVVTARDFVLWANGHPELAGLGLDLHSLRSAVVVGAGNVALDCARLLLRGKGELLRGTDASREALSAALALGSDDEGGDAEGGEAEGAEGLPLRTVHVVARRGAAQAAFSAKELREALSLPGVSVFVHHPPPFGDDAAMDPSDRAELAASRRAARVFELLRKTKKAAEAGGGGAEAAGGRGRGRKELHFHFLRSPVELIAEEEDDGDGASSSPPRVAAVRLVANRLESRRGEGGRTRRVAVAVAAPAPDGDGGGAPAAAAASSPRSSPPSPSVPTFLTLPAQLVIAALGFRTPSLGEGTPFDERRGVVPSGGGGRVSPPPPPPPPPEPEPAAGPAAASPPFSPAAAPPDPLLLPGLYVTGWARRGPTGIIGENLRDAAEVADAVATDAAELMTTRRRAEGVEGENVKDSPSPPGLPSLLLPPSSSSSSRPPYRVVGIEGWAKIDALERERAAQEVEERAEAEKARARARGGRRGGGEGGGGGGEEGGASSSIDAPPRVKLLTAEELLRAAGV